MISLRPEHEQLIAEAIQAGLIRTPEEAFEGALESLRMRLQASQSRTAADAVERLASFGKRHGLTLDGLTVLDLIHEGRP
jgi:hypothetical protein